jgi:rare lipoprotein A
VVGRKFLFYGFLFLILFSQNTFSQEKKKKIYSNKKATYYHDMFINRKTSSGERFDQNKYTAAHKTIPLNTLVKVTNKQNGKSVIVKVNDRCPKQGVIDLSLIAAKRLDMIKSGVVRVSLEILGDDYLPLWQKQDEIFNIFDVSMKKNFLETELKFDTIDFFNN